MELFVQLRNPEFRKLPRCKRRRRKDEKESDAEAAYGGWRDVIRTATPR